MDNLINDDLEPCSSDSDSYNQTDDESCNDESKSSGNYSDNESSDQFVNESQN